MFGQVGFNLKGKRRLGKGKWDGVNPCVESNGDAGAAAWRAAFADTGLLFRLV
jgi:hypothetical protein